MCNNATVKLVFGGLTVAKHLDHIWSLCGQRDERLRSHCDNGDRRSRSVALRRVRVLPPDAVRTLGVFAGAYPPPHHPPRPGMD
jgi:hypothetical protein